MKNEIIIEDIYWDRIWLCFRISGGHAPFFLVNSESGYYASLKSMSNDSPADFPDEIAGLLSTCSSSLYKINITNPGNCNMISDGDFILTDNIESFSHKAKLTDLDESSYSDIASLSPSAATHINDFSRIFSFGNKGNFLVNIRILENDNAFPFFITFQTVNENNYSFMSSLKKLIVKTVYSIDKLIWHHKNGNNILIFSDQNENGSSNLSAFSEKLSSSGYQFDTEYRSLLTNHSSIKDWFRTIKKLARANFIFLDDHSPTLNWLTLKDTVIIQLWHAGVGFKSTGYSRFGMPASPGTKSGHRQYTYGITGSDSIRHYFSEVWGINESMVLPAGLPRMDTFLNSVHQSECIKILTDKYPILKNVSLSQNEQYKSNLVLYAPTYRGKNKKFAYFPFEKIDFDELYFICNKLNIIFAFKMHPFVSMCVPIPSKFSDRIIDLSEYPDINDIFLITDILISDYSSDIYEFSALKRPMLFFDFDFEEYSLTRGFHRNYKKSIPGAECKSFDTLLNKLEQIKNDSDFRNELIEKASNESEKNFTLLDQKSCERIIDWIINKHLPDEIQASIENEKKSVGKI